MEQTQLATITASLRAEETKLTEELSEHQQRVTDIKHDLDRLRTAIKALDANGTARKKRRAASKPPASQTEVSNAVADALATGEPLTKDAIKQAVEAAVTKAGKSRVGLGLRLEQALKDDLIEEADGSYRLAVSST